MSSGWLYSEHESSSIFVSDRASFCSRKSAKVTSDSHFEFPVASQAAKEGCPYIKNVFFKSWGQENIIGENIILAGSLSAVSKPILQVNTSTHFEPCHFLIDFPRIVHFLNILCSCSIMFTSPYISIFLLSQNLDFVACFSPRSGVGTTADMRSSAASAHGPLRGKGSR